MRTFFIGRGDCTLGRVQKDAAGNVTKQIAPKFETNPDGGCVAICDIDPDTMQTVGAGEVYGDWDAANYLRRVLEKLEPSRAVNIPDFRKIIRTAQAEDGVDLIDTMCGYCDRCGYSCRDCILNQWKDEAEDK